MWEIILQFNRLYFISFKSIQFTKYIQEHQLNLPANASDYPHNTSCPLRKLNKPNNNKWIWKMKVVFCQNKEKKSENSISNLIHVIK